MTRLILDGADLAADAAPRLPLDPRAPREGRNRGAFRVTTNPPVVLVKRSALLAALSISSETLRRWLAAGKCPRPDVDMGGGRQWWHPQTLAAAGIRLEPADHPA